MKRALRRSLVAVTALALAGCAGLLEPGFRSLTNGKDLEGWHKNPENIVRGTGGPCSSVGNRRD